ncbi:MAG: class C sortase [Actinomycetaceae bacterium]|nr:class C sortase [Actinomycetaceae bacterium]
MRLFVLRLLTSALILLGGGLVLYSDAASWLTQYRQSEVINALSNNVGKQGHGNADQLKAAKEYNAVLSSGADLLAHHNTPTGAGSIAEAEFAKLKPYEEILKADFQGLMGRVRIDAIDVDLPVYHGTSESVLLRGVGHLQGTSFPVGGAGTHTVLTAHRGLAQSKLFTDLDQLVEGDTFVVEVFGEVLTYKVFLRQVVEPGENESLRAVEGKDLATLVTCTPLGINSHRILVTGERIEPTPIKDLEHANEPSALPRFPWWMIWASGFILLATANTLYAVRDHTKRSSRTAKESNSR